MSTIARLVTPSNPDELIWEADTGPEGIQIVAWYPEEDAETPVEEQEPYHAILLPWVACYGIVELFALREPARFQAILRRFAALGIAMEGARRGQRA